MGGMWKREREREGWGGGDRGGGGGRGGRELKATQLVQSIVNDAVVTWCETGGELSVAA